MNVLRLHGCIGRSQACLSAQVGTRNSRGKFFSETTGQAVCYYSRRQQRYICNRSLLADSNFLSFNMQATRPGAGATEKPAATSAMDKLSSDTSQLVCKNVPPGWRSQWIKQKNVHRGEHSTVRVSKLSWRSVQLPSSDLSRLCSVYSQVVQWKGLSQLMARPTTTQRNATQCPSRFGEPHGKWFASACLLFMHRK